MIIRTQQPTSMGIHTRSWIFINTKNSHQKCKNPLCYWFVQNLKNWSRSQKVLTSLLVFIFGYKSMWCKEDWSVSGHLQHQNEFTHIICLCLLLLSVSNPFFLRGKIVIFSRKKKKKKLLLSRSLIFISFLMYTLQKDTGEYQTKALRSASDSSQLLDGIQGISSSL